MELAFRGVKYFLVIPPRTFFELRTSFLIIFTGLYFLQSVVPFPYFFIFLIFIEAQKITELLGEKFALCLLLLFGFLSRIAVKFVKEFLVVLFEQIDHI